MRDLDIVEVDRLEVFFDAQIPPAERAGVDTLVRFMTSDDIFRRLAYGETLTEA